MPGLQDAAIQIAETIQTAHINKNPSIERDLAPSTATDKKVAVEFDHSEDILSELEADDLDDDEVPLSVLKPLPPSRRAPQMQLPDLRFEQSYLKSISEAKSWQVVAYITIKDQVLMPLVQGVAWTLAVAWWRYWNTATKFSGQTMGAKIRRWWWGVNNWKTPDTAGRTLRDQRLTAEMKDFYAARANSGFD